MGVNSKTSHATHPVATTALLDPPTTDPTPSAHPHLDELTELVHVPDPAGHYDQVVTAAQQHQPGDSDLDTQIKQLTGAYLQSLTPDELVQLAGEHGFTHPGLVGLSGTSPHPLAHWLDPAYPPDCPSKAKIQAVAQQRYDALAAGETVAGLTIADLPPAPSPSPTADSWSATPEQFMLAQAHLTEAVAELNQTTTSWSIDSQQVSAVIDAENRLQTADCPQLGQAPGPTKAAARHLVDAALAKVTKIDHVQPAVAKAAAAGTLTEPETRLLDPRQQLALMRRSTPADEQAELHELANVRQAQLATLADSYATYSALHPNPLAPLTLPAAATAEQIAGFAAAAAAYHQARAAVHGWAQKTAGWPDVWAEHQNALNYMHSPGGLTTSFRAWAKTQPLPSLRTAAAEAGLEHAGTATRAQVQNYLIAGWDATTPAASIQQAVTAAATKPAAQPAPKPTTVKTTTGWPAATPATAGAGAVRAVGGQGWASGHRQLLDALKHAAATHAAVPTRHDDAAVAGWNFTAATPVALGGMHTKSVHAAPDGSLWMFKPDKTAHGARAHAEATASKVFASVGIPSVPVYVKEVAGQPGSLQPLMPGAKDLSSDPKSWSQSDVDAIVRYHVAAWAIGDHDGKPDNVLRTPGGGLVPIDQGCAFKHYGSDKLALGYQPYSPPVFHLAYRAHKNGGLAPGVKINPAAAHPVLKAFEAMPDSQWRALLHSTAHEGAARNVSWAATMRKRAAKRHGIPAAKVSSTQVADEFLDHAVARKASLRADFAKFFAGELDLTHALAHG